MGDRCWESSDPLYNAYHDEEWGRPVVDERGLYERLCLEGFQSGLSWLTILRKRDAFRAAFAEFDPERVAAFGARDVRRLLADAGVDRVENSDLCTSCHPELFFSHRRDGGRTGRQAGLVWRTG